jgi:hypothetical protein
VRLRSTFMVIDQARKLGNTPALVCCRYDRKSTLITSQLPVDQWHGYLGDRTVADAIFDRLVHNSYRLVLKGESMRKRRTVAAINASPKAKHR